MRGKKEPNPLDADQFPKHENKSIIILTGVSEVLILVIGGKKSIVLGGLRLLLGEVLVLDFGKLDHYDGGRLKVLIKRVVSERKKKCGELQAGRRMKL